jgi:hypothetical protein
MNVLKELISQVKRKEIKDYDDLMAVLQYVKAHEEINKKDMFAYKICFYYDDYNQTCYCDRKPCKGKCEVFKEDWNKVYRY